MKNKARATTRVRPDYKRCASYSRKNKARATTRVRPDYTFDVYSRGEAGPRPGPDSRPGWRITYEH